MTDNLAMMFTAWTILLAFRFLHGGHVATVALASAAMAAAILTRQFCVWLVALPAAAALARRGPFDRALLVRAIALSLLSTVPFFLLVVLWHGLTPPGFQFHLSASPSLRPLAFAIACLGLYSLPFLLVQAWQRWPPDRSGVLRTALAVAAVTAVLLWIAPLSHVNAGSHEGFVTDGFLWRISRTLPGIGGSSLLFYGLIPAGLLALLRAPRDQTGFLCAVMFLAFAAASLAQASLYQKYYDAVALTVCFLLFGRTTGKAAYCTILALYCAGFVAYAILRHLLPAT